MSAQVFRIAFFVALCIEAVLTPLLSIAIYRQHEVWRRRLSATWLLLAFLTILLILIRIAPLMLGYR